MKWTSSVIGVLIGAGVNYGLAVLWVILGVSGLGFFLVVAIVNFLVGLVMTVIAVRMGQSAARRERILQTGISGVATLLSADQTGVYVNGMPQVRMRLRIDLPGQPEYEVQRSEVLGFLEIGHLQAGARYVVKADPADPRQIVVDWNSPAGMEQPMAAAQAPVFDASAPAAGMNSVNAQLAMAHLQQSGVDGTGTVMSFEDLGAAPSGNHQVKYDMLIAVPGQAPYTIHKESELPAVAIPMMQVGKTFSVKVDPANPDHPLMTVV
ncbi:MAG TPA: hypothetical protein VF134_09095 [Candidatus Dormibacteraeota bacterium]